MPEVLCEDKVREQLKQVIDPELFVNIVDLGLIYVVDLAPNSEDAEKTDGQSRNDPDQPNVSSWSTAGRE